MARKNKPLPALEWLQPRVRLVRAISLASYVALLLLVGIWNGLFADLHGARTWVVLSILLVPLLIVAPGVLLGQARAHAWLCFVVNLYFIRGVLAAFDPARSLYGWTEASISLMLFCSALLYTRWKSQLDRRQAGES
ncbi:DUF2069 domain-containing protein [Pseudomonas oligotrophica]|uniref:DUF2069 domain-containing protein n=1 Tax=Pseudomonas oligotrophica TaxID=2912055 RepID=UPI001F2B01BE|nr:DUF2069 domain-containing protein [Pseudomonas oligotrophica]